MDGVQAFRCHFTASNQKCPRWNSWSSTRLLIHTIADTWGRAVYIHIFTVDSLKLVISFSLVCPTFLTFPFLPSFHARLSSSSFFSCTFSKSRLGFSPFSLPHVASNLACLNFYDFTFRGYICPLKRCGIEIVKYPIGARKPHECVHFLFSSTSPSPPPPVLFVFETIVEYSTVHYAFIQFSCLESVANYAVMVFAQCY